ncbi:hypothetical protein FZEAL_765 [Fusarium zealandicum]|uniref:Chitinase n=1 Tax=Fusarium zealandicum TaxID=1053134 RepID=A0A8H4UUJ5_9HYPO|nr:hypothetical protein FZEAL_765 [Fusarium zealandicum]
MTDRAVTDAARERETFRHDSVLVANSIRNDPENLKPSSELRSCCDPALTALAQVAVLRLNATRAIISLFDCQYQHIIAEATPQVRIAASAPSPLDDSQKLWLCGTAVPRSFGVCEHLLTSSESAAAAGTIPVTVISDLAEHDVFRDKPYCHSWPRHRFYAGVPIQSCRGINIGVLSIFDDKPRSGLDEASVGFMQDLSNSILGHLELRRSGDHRRPGERMVRGLGSYVEGKATMSGWQDSITHAFELDALTGEGALNSGQQDLQRQRDEFESDAMVDETEPGQAGETERGKKQKISADSFVVTSPNENAPSTFTQSSNNLLHPVAPQEDCRQLQLDRIFSKAANILRESIEVEGVLFLDASIASFAGMVGNRTSRRDPRGKDRSSSSSSSSVYGDSSRSPSISLDGPEASPATCSVMGFSTSQSSSVDGESPVARTRFVSERHLQKLLRRYPKGKIFTFDEHGTMASSDFSTDDAGERMRTQTQEDKEQGTQDHEKPARQRKDSFSRKNDGKAIAGLFPGARSVAFVPLWDSHRQRWFSGCFVYTMTPTRIFTVRGELSYLTAFGAVIMADIAMMESTIVSTATTSLLSSLSHELRSPLHGIVLCAELLRDTSLDVFQGDVLRSLEVCGRTLLDTINHLLDWTKINNFMKSPQERKGSPRRPSSRGLRSGRRTAVTDGMMHLASDIDLDMLVEEVVECVHAGHTYQQQSMLRLDDQESFEDFNVHPHTRLDARNAAENASANGVKPSSVRLGPNRVVVILDIDPTVDWAFQAQPGALRRILMNLYSNSLKYTSRGFVKVAAWQEPLEHGGPRDRAVCIDIVDTGSGIGKDYLNHRLFAPFAQEDAHTSGAGLGLSLVRKFVRAIGGSIRLESEIDKGTKVSVKLPLQIAGLEATETTTDCDEFRAQVAELSRIRVSVIGFSPAQSGWRDDRWESGEFDEEASLEKICRNWLDMDVIGDDRVADFIPDLILCDECHLNILIQQARSEISSPVIVVCRSATVARQLEKSHKTRQKLSSGLFSFISRPLGPRKLAKAFVLSFRHWVRLQAASGPDALSISTILDRPMPVPTANEPGIYESWAHEPWTNGSQGSDSRVNEPQPCEPQLSEPQTSESQNNEPQINGVTNNNVQNHEAQNHRNTYPSDDNSNGYFDASHRPGDLPRVESLNSTKGTMPVIPESPENQPSSPCQPRFLLVEDNPINMRILQTCMKKLGHEYDAAGDGRQALDSYISRQGKYRAWMLAMALAESIEEPFRCIMYLTGQHDIVPPEDRVQGVSHVILAFMRSEVFNVDETPSEFSLFTTVSEVRSKFPQSTRVMVAIGGWGNTRGFEDAAKDESSRQRWARHVAAMVVATGADGVDIDWEYPGGNRDDYKLIPNSEREWEVEAFVALLQETRAALGPDKLLSAAVPGKEADLMAFTIDTVPRIMKVVDFLNIMTYDLMNRRDSFTKHHSGVSDSREAIQRYMTRGASPDQVNLGFGYYVKWFMTEQCNAADPRGCATRLLEDPETGGDLGGTGGFSWHDETPEDVAASFARAQAEGSYDDDGSYYYWDARELRWWSFDTRQSIQRKFDQVGRQLNVGGVFAWGLGEDAPRFEHFDTTMEGVRKMRAGGGVKDEL